MNAQSTAAPGSKAAEASIEEFRLSGSPAHLLRRLRKAEDAGRTEVVDRVQERLDNRPKQIDRLAAAKTRIEQFRDEKCG